MVRFFHIFLVSIFRDCEKRKGRKRKREREGRKNQPRLSHETLRNYVLSRKNVIYGVCSSFLAVSYIFPLCFLTFALMHTWTHEHAPISNSFVRLYDNLSRFFSSHVLLFRIFPARLFLRAEFYDFRRNTASKDLHCNVVYVILSPFCFESNAL